MGSRDGAGREQVEASEASVKYKFKYLLCWRVLSMQRMNKDADGRKPQQARDMRSPERSRLRPAVARLYRTREGV